MASNLPQTPYFWIEDCPRCPFSLKLFLPLQGASGRPRAHALYFVWQLAGMRPPPPPRPGLRLGAPPGLGGLVTSMPLPSPAENSAPCLAEWTCGEGGDCQGPLLRFWQVGAELPRPRCGGDGIDSQTESLGSNPSSATMARHLTSQFPALGSMGLTGAPTAQVVDTLGGHMGWRVGSLLI